MTEKNEGELFDPRPGDGYEVPVDSEGNPITDSGEDFEFDAPGEGDPPHDPPLNRDGC